MNQQEQARIQVLNSVLEHRLPIAQAAEIMGVSERHTKRLLAAYRKHGAAARAHGNRGRKPHNAVPETAAAVVVRLASNGYAGANHSHFTELLREPEGIDLSRPTVRRILVRAGIGSPRSRRSQQHRFRRWRMPREGMLVQIDGSEHPWLEDRGPKLTLLIAVGDATGTVAQAVFRTTEDTRGYPVLLEGLVRQWGIPLAIYSDRHAAFKYNARKKPVPVETTQFARVMRELGIQQIFAPSPQAKGRVERMLETFQDRLVTELRLAKATTIQKANGVLERFVPRFNAQFGVPAEQPDTAYRPADPNTSLAEILCFKHSRKVAKDNTVKYNWRTLQLLPGQERRSYAGAQVEVLEHTDGSLRLRHEGRIISSREAPRSPGALRGTSGTMAPTPEIGQVVSRLVQHGLTQPQLRKLSSLEPLTEDGGQTADAGPSTLESPEERVPTPRQEALWKAVHHAKLQGLSPREIARELGIARNTVRRYARALAPPANRPRDVPGGITTGISHPIGRLAFPLVNWY